MEQDDQQAVAWYLKAAEQGYANAQFNLGWAYLNGHGVTEDRQQALAWYSKAAEQGHADAQSMLGVMYGIAQDDRRAYFWSSVAAANGSADAVINRDLSAKRLPPAVLEEVEVLIGEYVEQYRPR
ncbi:putative beta-lactamase HcpC precursor [compost metagenome]